MLQIDRPIIVEGKFDKQRLSRVIDTLILTTDGFGIFRSEEKKQLIRRLAGAKGVIVLTDSDGAGLVIRNFLRGILPSSKILHLYIPPIPGKEKRKRHPSAEGLLGVEGIEEKLLYDLFLPFASETYRRAEPVIPVTKADFYADGFSGLSNSRFLRASLARICDLPQNLSANALLEAVNLLGGVSFYKMCKDKMLSGETDAKNHGLVEKNIS